MTNDKEGVATIPEQCPIFAKKMQNTLKGVKET